MYLEFGFAEEAPESWALYNQEYEEGPVKNTEPKPNVEDKTGEADEDDYATELKRRKLGAPKANAIAEPQRTTARARARRLGI